MLSVERISKSYGSLRAVDGLGFLARPGEIFGLIGPNGAGKTTTIRMIMNVIAPDEGTIRFGGESFTEAMKSGIGYLPEERGLYRKARVLEMLLYLAALKGTEKAASRASAEAWLERFGLSAWKNRRVEDLSKGMAQKVQFIGAVIHDPGLVLFDEPFAGLDPLSQDLLLDAMVELKRRGKTVLLSTHAMDNAERICDRILLMRAGRELIAGTVAEVKARYGGHSVQVEFDGDASFVRALPCVEDVRAFPRWIEVTLREGAASDELLAAIVGRIRVRRFEAMSPSLHKIFVDLVGAGEAGHE